MSAFLIDLRYLLFSQAIRKLPPCVPSWCDKSSESFIFTIIQQKNYTTAELKECPWYIEGAKSWTCEDEIGVCVRITGVEIMLSDDDQIEEQVEAMPTLANGKRTRKKKGKEVASNPSTVVTGAPDATSKKRPARGGKKADAAAVTITISPPPVAAATIVTTTALVYICLLCQLQIQQTDPWWLKTSRSWTWQA